MTVREAGTYYGHCPYCGELMGFGHIPDECKHRGTSQVLTNAIDHVRLLSLAGQLAEAARRVVNHPTNTQIESLRAQVAAWDAAQKGRK